MNSEAISEAINVDVPTFFQADGLAAFCCNS